MSKPRDPTTWAGAVWKLAGAFGGPEMLAEMVGRQTSLIRKWADGDTSSLPSIEHAYIMDASYVREFGGPPPLGNLYMDKILAIDTPPPKAEPALTVFKRLHKEVHEAVQAAMEAIDVSPCKRTEALQEVQEAIDELQDMQRRLSMPRDPHHVLREVQDTVVGKIS